MKQFNFEIPQRQKSGREENENRMKLKHIHQLQLVVRERDLAGRCEGRDKVSSTSSAGQRQGSGKEGDNSTRRIHISLSACRFMHCPGCETIGLNCVSGWLRQPHSHLPHSCATPFSPKGWTVQYNRTALKACLSTQEQSLFIRMDGRKMVGRPIYLHLH